MHTGLVTNLGPVPLVLWGTTRSFSKKQHNKKASNSMTFGSVQPILVSMTRISGDSSWNRNLKNNWEVKAVDSPVVNAMQNVDAAHTK